MFPKKGLARRNVWQGCLTGVFGSTEAKTSAEPFYIARYPIQWFGGVIHAQGWNETPLDSAGHQKQEKPLKPELLSTCFRSNLVI
ncbi:hypothetical protein [Nisaea sp.]|uniref:hypothetical protein n=1 Tax=Nisaea sp. TaxID=2024842 RepID=UPI003264B83A